LSAGKLGDAVDGCRPPIPAVHLQEAETAATTTAIKLASAVTGGTDLLLKSALWLHFWCAALAF
jgi:glutamate-1-semialdehyde aminotransferase